MKYHIVYSTQNTINGKFYIGVHSTNKIEDGYIGSGCRSQATAEAKVRNGLKSPFLEDVVKFGYNNFRRVILNFYDTREEAFEEEKFLVDRDFIERDDTYNESLGGRNGRTFVLTRDQEQELLKDYSNGMERGELLSKYGVSYAVVHSLRTAYNIEIRKPVLTTSKEIQNWIERNSQFYIDKYKRREITKSEIGSTIPFYLWKNDFLKGVTQDPRFICITPDGREIPFDTEKEISDILGVKLFRSGFAPVAEGKYKQYKGFKFKFYGK